MKHVPLTLALILALLLSIAGSGLAFAQRGVGVKGRGQATPYISGTYRALVIGNDKYRDPEGLWKPLKTAVNDARAVADVLKNLYGFGDVRLLLNATRRQLNKAINRISEDSRQNDSVLIYYAGHGFLRESTKEGYWIPVDAEGRDDGTFYPNSTIKTKLAVLSERAKHVLLVSDSCFSGALLRSGNRGISLDQRNEGYFRKVAAKKSVQILAAGGLEFVDDNYKGTGHSPFTYFFLEELKTNTSGLLDATQLSSAVVRNVANNVQQSPEKGVLHGAGHEGGEFFFARAKVVKPPPVAKIRPPTPPPVRPSIDAEGEFWKTIKDSQDKTDYEAYLKEYPKGRFAGLARVRIRQSGKKGQAAQDREFWDAVKDSKDPAEFEAYLIEFPKGRYVRLARLKMRRLKKAAGKSPPPKTAAAPSLRPSRPSPPTVAAITAPIRADRGKPPSLVPKVALFPGYIPSSSYSGYSGETNKNFLGKLFKVFSKFRKKFRLSHSFYDEKSPWDGERTSLKHERDLEDNSWRGFFSKKPNKSFLIKTGKRLKVDFLILYELYFQEFCSALGPGDRGGIFKVHLIDVETEKIHTRTGPWGCENRFAEPAEAMKKLLVEKVRK